MPERFNSLDIAVAELVFHQLIQDAVAVVDRRLSCIGSLAAHS